MFLEKVEYAASINFSNESKVKEVLDVVGALHLLTYSPASVLSTNIVIS